MVARKKKENTQTGVRREQKKNEWFQPKEKSKIKQASHRRIKKKI